VKKALDTAKYLVYLASQESEAEFISHMRLQKLLYYIQGWSLAIRHDAAFGAVIEAWQHGPVVPSVFREMKNQYQSLKDQPIPFAFGSDPESLSDNEKGFIRSVWDSYKRFSATELRNKTHKELPWLIAYRDCAPGEHCSAEITQESMRQYFSETSKSIQFPGLEFDEIEAAEKELSSGGGRSLSSVIDDMKS